MDIDKIVDKIVEEVLKRAMEVEANELDLNLNEHLKKSYKCCKYVCWSSARVILNGLNSPVDATIVEIVDKVDINEEY